MQRGEETYHEKQDHGNWLTPSCLLRVNRSQVRQRRHWSERESDEDAMGRGSQITIRPAKDWAMRKSAIYLAAMFIEDIAVRE